MRSVVYRALVVLLLSLLLGLPGTLASTAQAQVHMKTDVTIGQEQLPLIDTDTLFYVDNRGLDRIFVNLSGHAFRLVSDPAEVDRAANAFPIPRVGPITLHVGAFIEPGGENYVRLASQGPPTADADVIIAPVFVRGQAEVAYRIETLDPLPARLQIRTYPNPFSDEATIQYAVPAQRINGVEVVIEVYDLLGRRVAVFDEGRRYPGTFERTWNAPPGGASGLYVARIRIGRSSSTAQMIRVR